MMKVRPITLRQAQAFVDAHHRHNKAPRGHKLSVQVVDDEGATIGVATLSRPIARSLDTGLNAEITRNCTLGQANACSMLYGALLRTAKAMGYHRVYTYTQADESGSSLRAVGFVLDAELPPRGNWAQSSLALRHKRDATATTGGVARRRWVVTFAGNA
jgi:hypothetical protein